MKILVFSDTHRRTEWVKKAVFAQMDKEKPDLVIHLGDGVKDMEFLPPHIPLCSVDGNCEEYGVTYFAKKKLVTELTAEIGGFRFFITHGQKYDVKDSPDRLIETAKRKNADVLLFGHTHRKYYTYLPPRLGEQRGLYVFNPGSPSCPRDAVCSCGIIRIENSNISFSFLYRNGEEKLCRLFVK